MDSLNKGQQLGHYQLHAWVVLANHVHALLTPRIYPSRLALEAAAFAWSSARVRLEESRRGSHE